VVGQYVGPESEMREVIAPLLPPGLDPVASTVGTLSFLHAALVWAGCGGQPVPACHLNGSLPGESLDGAVERAAYAAKSQFYDRPLGPDAVGVALAWLEARRRDPRLAGEGTLQLDAFGGAVNRVAPEATAFVHRASLVHGQFLTYWEAGDPADVAEANLDWMESFFAAMRPFSSGFAYQNYIDPALPDWPRAYYGANLARLMEVKRRYDPDGVFRFAQGIPRADAPAVPGGSARRRRRDA
jgi:hypothetical protein